MSRNFASTRSMRFWISRNPTKPLNQVISPGISAVLSVNRMLALSARQHPHPRLDPGPVARPRSAQFVRTLQVHPQLRGGAEIFRQTQRQRSGDGGAAWTMLLTRAGIDVDVARQPVLADA